MPRSSLRPETDNDCSGCTTLLKTIAGEMNGIYLDEGCEMNYRGMSSLGQCRSSPNVPQASLQNRCTSSSAERQSTPPRWMFTSLTLRSEIHWRECMEDYVENLSNPGFSFAAECRIPRQPPGGLTQKQFAAHSRDVMMSTFGISHTFNTIIGNEYIRGVSGGE